MKVYIPNTSKQTIGGGWTFLRNLKKAVSPLGVVFVDNLQDCDVVLIVGITITDLGEIQEAKRLGKGVVFRVDNVPKKSRNKRFRGTPAERMYVLSELSDVVIYQSRWAKEYAEPLCGDGPIIYNGVDTNIFYPAKKRPEVDTYLFAYHGKSELKQFWLAHYYYQMVNRTNPQSEFWFINEFGKDLPELQESNFDFWNGEAYLHLPRCETPEDMAKIMRQCTHFICPYTVDSAPNTLLEARACGLTIEGYVPRIGVTEGTQGLELSGVREYIALQDMSLERMGEEYFGVISLASQKI